ncbi:hypothetical protein B5F40_01710 [Gordonibacter sp. An230]|uniref:phage minor capsid protein n=1 Tax=Gordonibacter sp. An230 TaxID=1965592 RepID=UPI000B395203|nr:phage minor capsid protein [Gordonibacter sp. An230]OUO92075.1 hypothetical protein B5F40_01710 [Gordonibacter sp. An230]
MALTEADIQKLADSIVHGSEERMVAELFSRLCDSLADGAMGLADEAALERLASANAAMANELIAEYAGTVDDEVRGLVESVLIESSEADEASLAAVYGQDAAARAALAFAGGYSAHFAEIAAQTALGVAEVIRRQNLAMTERAERLWYEAAGEAVAAFNQGLLPREECVARAVSRLMAEGMETVDYASGVRNQLDVAVRRHVVTQASQAGGRMTLDRLEAYGHELVVTSAHYGARPSHAEWQGKPCAIHGAAEVDGVRYPGLAELTGYGTVGGLKGANCRHSINPYYPGITKLPAREWPEHEARFGMSSERYYEATQRQRELERRVRKTKREVSGMERAGIGFESPTYVQKRLVLGRQQAALRSHCADKGFVRQYARERAYGVGAQPRALRSASTKLYVSQMHGRANTKIDRFVPCLLDTKTGELVDTQVYKLTTRSQLKGYNSKTGWDINWEKAPKGVDVYGLTIKGQSELQGLIALREDRDAQAVYLHYAKTAPRNDKHATGKQDYEGVGGHLFALAVEISEKAGFGGYLYGFAEDAKLERHYIEKLGATHLGILHPYHFEIDERAARRLLKEYNYEWK